MDEEGARTGSPPNLDPGGDGAAGGADLISALPDDLLFHVLECLGPVRAAACTSLLSRRWSGLWTRLPKATVTLHDVPFDSIQDALRRAADRPGAWDYLLDIRVPGQDDKVLASEVSSLLHAASRLSPTELRFALARDLKVSCVQAELPCLRRATSVELQARGLHLGQAHIDTRVSRGPFPSLERLSLSGCHIDLATFIPRCPRLRLLSLNTTDLVDMPDITIHSASLEELALEHKNRWTAGLRRISVEVPLLKRLTMSFHARTDIEVSVLAPMLEKVSWRCLYTKVIYGVGLWGLSEVGLYTSDRPDSREDDHTCYSQLPSVHVLSLHICAQDSLSSPNAELSFVADVEKHMVTNFSSLDIHLKTKGHVFGAFVLHLIGMLRIRAAIRNLKIVLLRSEVKDACSADCLCDKPKYRRTTRSVSLPSLEKLEIEGVEGEDYEFDFLQEIFRCAPMLKHVTVKLSDEATPSDDWCMKINNVVKAYPAVECTVDLGPGSTYSSQSFASA